MKATRYYIERETYIWAKEEQTKLERKKERKKKRQKEAKRH